MIEDILIIIQSNIGIALICGCIAYWVFKLHIKNQKLESDKSIGGKADKEDVEELKEKIQLILFNYRDICEHTRETIKARQKEKNKLKLIT